MPEVETRTVGGLRVEARSGEVSVVLDEAVANGGEGSGLSPSETLLAALSGCAAMTMTLYARHKKWPLEGVRIAARLERPGPGQAEQPQRIVQTVELTGPLDADQRKRLLEIAGRCPVHRTLEGPLVLEERPA